MKKLFIFLTLFILATQMSFSQEVVPEERAEFSLAQDEINYIVAIIKWKASKDVKQEDSGLTSQQLERARFLCGNPALTSGELCYLGSNGLYYTFSYEWWHWPGEGNVLHYSVSQGSTTNCCN